MPLYAYRCTQCGHRYEKIQNFSAEPETVCPKCGGKLERPLTAPGLQFKGAGWYINDYAPKSSGSASSADKPAGETTAAGDSKAADSKASESKSTAAESKPAATDSASKPSSTTSSN